MAEIYVKVRQPQVMLSTEDKAEDRLYKLQTAARDNVNVAKGFVRSNWPDAVICPSSLYPSFTAIINDVDDMNAVLSKIRQNEVVELAEAI